MTVMGMTPEKAGQIVEEFLLGARPAGPLVALALRYFVSHTATLAMAKTWSVPRGFVDCDFRKGN